MNYTRNYDVRPVVEPADPFVPFHKAKDGVGYENPTTGDIRVRTGTNYIKFTNSGAVSSHVAACLSMAWPVETRESWEVEVDISLKVWRKA